MRHICEPPWTARGACRCSRHACMHGMRHEVQAPSGRCRPATRGCRGARLAQPTAARRPRPRPPRPRRRPSPPGARSSRVRRTPPAAARQGHQASMIGAQGRAPARMRTDAPRSGKAMQCSRSVARRRPPHGAIAPPRSGGYPEDKAGSDAGLTRVCHASAFPHASRTREGCASALLLLRRRSARMRSAGRPSATVHACVHIYMRERKRCPAVPAAERIDGLATNAAPARVARRRLCRGGSAAVPLFQSLILGAHP